MKHSLTIVCDENLASGLRLAGFDAHGVVDTDACDALVTQSLNNRHAEVVVVDTTMRESLPEDTLERMAESDKPLFVSLPLTTDRGNEEVHAFVHNYVEELFRKTIGKNLAISSGGE